MKPVVVRALPEKPVVVRALPEKPVVVRALPEIGPPGLPGQGAITRERLTGEPDGFLFSFNASAQIEQETVFVNGLAQRPGIDYTTVGSKVIFTEAPELGDYLSIIRS